MYPNATRLRTGETAKEPRDSSTLSLISSDIINTYLSSHPIDILIHSSLLMMGGGAAMRAASKVATYGITAGLRGVGSSPLPEHSLPAAARNASKPVAAAMVTSTAEDVKAPVLIANGDDAASGMGRNRSWEMDDWEFAGVEVSDSLDPMPRVVFGGVPTLQEAREATEDLKEALEKEYFFNAIGSNHSSTGQESPLSKSGHSETKACITSENVLLHSQLPKPVFHAFSMLKESPEAQGVVASLASDKNVWDAVMQNDKVMEFIKNQQNGTPAVIDDDVKESLKANRNVMEEENSEADSGSEFMDFVEKVTMKVKITVAEIVSSLSGFLHSIFGGPSEDKISVDDNGNATIKASMMGASFMALAVMTIMVAVLKRG